MTSPHAAPPGRLTDRLRALSAILLCLALLAAACGDDTGEADAPTDASSTGSLAGAFPVTVDHQFGSTEIPAPPERVVSLGYQEHDVLYALGVEPIAVRYWFGDESDVIHPWAQDEAGDTAPVVLDMPHGELNYEAIAALRPDLILGVYSGITAAEYGTLSEIAPTVAQPEGYVDFGIPWQEATRVAGEATGRSERAEELVAALEGRFAEVAAAHPEWWGLEVAVAAHRPQGIGVFASQDPRARFFRSLGFEVDEEIDTLAGDTFYATLSAERTDLLDGDLVVWDQMTYVEGGRDAIRSDPLVSNLEVMREGHHIYLEGQLEAAFAFNSVLSLPYVIDELVPMIEDALGP